MSLSWPSPGTSGRTASSRSSTCAKGSSSTRGSDFDAEVVRCNYLARRRPRKEDAFNRAVFWSLVDSVEAIDAHTVKFTLKHPSREICRRSMAVQPKLGFLQMSSASYKRWGRKDVRLTSRWGRDHSSWPSGSRTASSSSRRTRTTSNRGSPILERVELRIMKEGVTRVTALARRVKWISPTTCRCEHVERLTKDTPRFRRSKAKIPSGCRKLSQWTQAGLPGRAVCKK